MTMRSAILIANPKAGQANVKTRQEGIQRFCGLLKARGVDIEVRNTAGPNDATRLAAEAVCEGAREVIVSGGDGTINEALQALVGTNVRLAIWPRGTANVLGRALQLPTQLDRLADIIAAEKTRRIHVGRATAESTGNHRYFLLMAGIGIDAAVIEHVRPAWKNRVGKAAFWYSGLETFTRWNPKRFTVEVDGQQHEATFAVVGKAPHYGGDLSMTPRASMDKPEFEICIINAVHRLQYLKLLPFAMFDGIPERMKGVCYLRTSKARAIGEGVQAQVDGELIGPLPMSFSITPTSMEVITQ
jgi:YegS/Rv2252/BmrU family lipid kinase